MSEPVSTPILQSLLTIMASSVFAALTTLVVKGFGDREKIVAHIEWSDIRGPIEGPYFAPSLVVQNLSQRKVYVVSVVSRRGLFRFRSSVSTVLAFDDITDLPFPACIDPGAIRWFFLNNDRLLEEAEKAGPFEILLGHLFRRNRIKVEARTLVGGKAQAGGENALDSQDRPIWHERPWWR